jgi:hypothetical protein
VKELHRVFVAASLRQFFELPSQRVRPVFRSFLKRRLHENQPTQRNAFGSGVQCKQRTGRIAVADRPPADGVDQCRKVFDLPFGRIGLVVAALTAATTVVATDRKVGGQQWRELVEGA